MQTRAMILQLCVNLPYMQIWTMCLLFIERNVCVCACVCVYYLALSIGHPGNSSEYPHPSLSLWLSSLYKHKMSWELCASPGPPVPFNRLNLKLHVSRTQLQIHAPTTRLQSCRGQCLHQLSRVDPLFCHTQQRPVWWGCGDVTAFDLSLSHMFDKKSNFVHPRFKTRISCLAPMLFGSYQCTFTFSLSNLINTYVAYYQLYLS